jgi:hypothetical protein
MGQRAACGQSPADVDQAKAFLDEMVNGALANRVPV